MKKRISITIDEQLFDTFQDFCSQNGMKVSSKIELMVRDFLKQNRLSGPNGGRGGKK